MSLSPDLPSALPGGTTSTKRVRKFIIINPVDVWPDYATNALQSSYPDVSIRKYAELATWLSSPEFSSDGIVFLCFRNAPGLGVVEWVRLDCNLLRELSSDLLQVLVVDRDGGAKLSNLLSLGLCGFVSADLPPDIFVEALLLVSRGSRFFTASCFIGERTGRESVTEA